MLPLSLFADRTFSAAVAFGVFANLTYYGMVFVLSLYLQRVLGHSPLADRPRVPAADGRLPAVESGERTGRGALRLARADDRGRACSTPPGSPRSSSSMPSTPTVALLIPFLLIPSGMGLAVPAMTTAVLGAVARERAGTASAVLNTARQAAGAIGVAAFGALAVTARARRKRRISSRA